MGKLGTTATIIIGGLVGAGIMMFYAPTTGKKMRKRLMSRGMDLRDDAMDRAGDLQKNASKLIHVQNKRLSKQAKSRLEMARDVADDLRGAAQVRLMDSTSKVTKQAKQRMGDVRDYSDDVMSRGRKVYKTQKKKGFGFIGAGRRTFMRY